MRSAPMVFLFVGVALIFLNPISQVSAEDAEDYKILQQIIVREFQKEKASERGNDLPGVLSRFPTKDKKIALILTACSNQGIQMDEVLLQKLAERKIPAAVFVDQGWLSENGEKLKPYLKSGAVTVENHGLFCRSLSVESQVDKKDGVTGDVDQVYEEVERNARLIEGLTGRLPRFFKSAGDYYDDVSLKIVSVLGYVAVRGDLNLKSQHVENKETMQDFLKSIRPGANLSFPVNRPGKSEGWAPQLLDEIVRLGYGFVLLDDVIGFEERSD